VVTLTVCSLPTAHFEFYAKETFLAFVLYCSILFYCLVVFILLADRAGIQKILGPLARVGRIAFSAYYIHVAMILLLGAILSGLHLAIRDDAFGILSGILLLVLITYGLALWEKVWRRYEYRLGLEWILRKSSRLFVRLIA
jgi:uncharacterized membrane protein YeiB